MHGMIGMMGTGINNIQLEVPQALAPATSRLLLLVILLLYCSASDY